MYRFDAKLIRVYDGDTVYLKIDKWPDETQDIKLRLDGIDTPEIRTRRMCEKVLGIETREFLTELLKGEYLSVDNLHYGKYAGRYIGNLYIGIQDVGDIMISSGYAIKYAGGMRNHDWCNK